MARRRPSPVGITTEGKPLEQIWAELRDAALAAGKPFFDPERFDLTRVEKAGQVHFSAEARQSLVKSVGEFVWAEAIATGPVGTKKRKLRTVAAACERCAGVLKGNQVDIAVNLPFDIRPFIIQLENLSSCLRGQARRLPSGKAGRRRQDNLRCLIRDLFPLFKEAGGKSVVYRNRTRDDRPEDVGAYLDMLEEVLTQVAYRNQSRGALAKMIEGEGLSLR